MAATSTKAGTTLEPTTSPWPGFRTGLWQNEIDVRDFIQQNYTPYHGDDAFLAPATKRTQALWNGLQQLFVEERRKGVLDISQIPSSITAHATGYIDRAIDGDYTAYPVAAPEPWTDAQYRRLRDEIVDATLPLLAHP